MATNVTVRDLENYPTISKTVTVDQTTLVPVGYDGDEQWVLSFRTSAYSNNTSRTAIQDIYVREINAGWLKSSGMANLTGYTTSSGSKALKVKMDKSSGYYTITLAEGLAGADSIADAIENAIKRVPTISGTWNTSDDALAYKNCMVDFKDNKFYIVSGNFSKYYTGDERTSVKVDVVSGDTFYYDMGFDLSVDSESIASMGITEADLVSDYTADDQYLYTDAYGCVSGTCGVITDGSNTNYFQIIAVSGTRLTVPTASNNGFTAITNSYVSGSTKIQILQYQDPDVFPVPFHRTVDSVIKWGINSIVNQIDFSS